MSSDVWLSVEPTTDGASIVEGSMTGTEFVLLLIIVVGVLTFIIHVFQTYLIEPWFDEREPSAHLKRVIKRVIKSLRRII